MAKITWVFQDESGTNLNRYIATNVSTGEKVTFDLLRGGNISVVGTPLNADKLNSLINAINDNYDKLAELSQAIEGYNSMIGILSNNIDNQQKSINDIIEDNTNIKTDISDIKYDIKEYSNKLSSLEKGTNLELYYDYQEKGFFYTNQLLPLGYKYTIEVSNYSGTQIYAKLTFMAEEGERSENISQICSNCGAQYLKGIIIYYREGRIWNYGIIDRAFSSLVGENFITGEQFGINDDNEAKTRDLRISKIWREKINYKI